MPEYRRAFSPGGTFFFTAVSYDRRPIWADAAHVALLREAVGHVQQNHPFNFDAAVVLPDHLHFLWTLPPGDADFSTRWRLVKSRFTTHFLRAGGREKSTGPSRTGKSERGVWQRRFWEHTIRDERDFEKHVNYIHYNPVKHGLATCPHKWAYSSFEQWVKTDIYERTWQCGCRRRRVEPPDFSDIEEWIGEP